MSKPPGAAPTEPEAEKAIVGAIIQGSIAGSPRTAEEVLDSLRQLGLQAEDFATPYGDVYRRALELQHEQKPVNRASLESAMRVEWSVDGLWANLLHQAYMDTPHTAHAEYNAKLVKAASNQRRMLYAMRQATEDIYRGGIDLADVLAPVVAEMDAQAEHRTNGRGITAQAILLDVIAELEADELPGVRTGFHQLDRATGGGPKPGQMITLAARPGVGKTSLMLAIAYYIAEHFGQVLIISQEMSRGELMLRLIARECGVRVDDLRGFIRNERQRPRFVKATEDISRVPLVIDDQPGRTIADVEALARIHKRSGGLSLICLDYLQLFRAENRRASTEEQVSAISRDCKMLAKSMGCPVLVLSQLNRAVENRDNRRPRLADLRSSGAIEQDSDIVAFIDRPATYAKNVPPDEAFLVIAKNRNGETTDIPLTWHGRTMSFSNVEDEQWPTADTFDPMGGNQ